MKSQGWWSDSEEKEVRQKMRQEVLKAFADAEKKPKPPISDLFTDVYDQLTPQLVEQQLALEEVSGCRADAVALVVLATAPASAAVLTGRRAANRAASAQARRCVSPWRLCGLASTLAAYRGASRVRRGRQQRARAAWLHSRRVAAAHATLALEPAPRPWVGGTGIVDACRDRRPCAAAAARGLRRWRCGSASRRP